MKQLFFSLLILCTVAANSQCEPDKRFVPSATIELTSDWGMIVQGGITGQLSPISIHAGIRAREFVDSDSSKSNYSQAKVLPRLELGYRIIDGLHLNVGIAKQNDVSVTWYKRIGDQTAIYGRGLYDGSVVFAIGLKVIFYKQ